MEAIFNKPSKNVFTDLSFTMFSHPITKDLALNVNENAIKNAVKNLILTKPYERPFHPEIGCNVYGMLFEPISPFLANYIETEIHNILTRYEPRIKLSSISVLINSEGNGYDVTISFYIINQTIETTISLFLEKLR